MIRNLLIALLIVLTGCGSSTSKSTISTSQELRGVVGTYISLGNPSWAYPEDCDGLLFSALTAVGRNEPIDIELAQGEPGQWFRNPSHECYPQGSASDVSRDMLLGLVVYSVHFHRLDILEDLYSYGHDHNWIMGQGDRTTTILSPAFIGRLCRAIEFLGGAHHAEAAIPDLPSVAPGYTSHLALLGILVDGKISGSISDLDLAALRSIVSQEPGNALAQALLHKYTDGDQTTATQILLAIWPHDRLPNNSDWCDSWRIQRADNDPSLRPCTTGIIHSGGDLLLVASVIEDSY